MRLVRFAILASSILQAILPTAHAWDNHFFGTSIALSEMQEVKNAPEVRTETLEDFLASVTSHPDDIRAFSTLLESVEKWAQENIPHYSPLPSQLKFKASTDPRELRLNFLHAIRVNPTMKLPLFLQILPDKPTPNAHPHQLEPKDFTLVPSSIHLQKQRFQALKNRENVSFLSVISSASDEPDYGLDVGLFEDNGTSFGAIYGFGKQPFGNPRLEYSSQAPFHMGFFYESKIIETAAPFIKQTYSEYRFYLFRKLSQFAFETGHPYWSARFAGWAIHYVQDLTQPYHSTVMPGASTLTLLMINGMDLLGYHQLKDDALQVLTNQHLALENYAFYSLYDALTSTKGSEILSSIRQFEEPVLSFPVNYLREVVAKESHDLALRTQQTLKSSLPPRLVSDPHYYFGETEPNLDTFSIMDKQSVNAQNEMQDLLRTLMRNFGKHSRTFYHTLLSKEF